MSLTPDQARARLTEARRLLDLPVKIARGREGFDIEAMRTMALLEVIQFLEDALT
jgi:hypothetical protein